MPEQLNEILEKWHNRKAEYSRLHAHVDAAALVAEVIEDLTAAARAEESTTLTIAQAAAKSGYSAEHIRRLIAKGHIPNAGRKGAPRVPSAAVRKRRRPEVASNTKRPYDPDADVRLLQGARAGDTNGA